MQEIQLSEYGRASSLPSPANQLMAEFACGFRDGVDINLGVGYVNERTIPATEMRRAFDCVLDNPGKYRQSLNYGGPTGSENLIESIRRYLLERRVGGLTAEILARNRVIIGPNGATSLLESVAYVLPRGIVVTSDPTYYIYTNFLERRGFDLLAVPEDGEGIRTDLLEARLDALGDRLGEVAFFYVVTINNPSCVILSNRRRRELVASAARLSQRLCRRILVIMDRAYEDLVHDPDVGPLESGLLSDTEGLVYEVGTLSKVFAPALRIGYMIGRPGSFMDVMVQRTFDAGFSAPLITQEISSWLLDNQLQSQLARVREGYRSKARIVCAWVQQHLGDELESVSGGRAGFYLYLTFRSVETHQRSPFFRYLARTTGETVIDGARDSRNPRVVYIPGEICVHPRGEMAERGKRQLRISYGFEELEPLQRAIVLMREAISYARRRA